MANSIISSTFQKVGHVGAAIAWRSTWNPRLFLASSPRYIQASSHPEAAATFEKATEGVKQAADEAMRTGENLKNKAASTAEQMTQNSKDMAGEMAESTQVVSEKAKQKMQDAWGSAKDSAQKVQDSILGNAKAAKERVRQNAERVEESMNTKE